MPAATVNVGPVTVTYVHEDPVAGYVLLVWEAPPGAASPPMHVHHRTDEGFYVLSGLYRFLVDGETIDGPAGSHVLVRAGAAHTFWNAGDVAARCLVILTPPDFAPYFRELSIGLANAKSEEDSIEVRRHLSARFDIEVVGPMVKP
ncbi:MAG TPA: cupin domain-containing protein [Candidatus Dormibacteraeota bacterium]|nr:cupin domain-containing protein [Candidatus Dormibacteraeota bacterium]